MAAFAEHADDVVELVDERQHGIERLSGRNAVARPGPDVAHWHRAESTAATAAFGLDFDGHIYNFRLRDNAAAKFDWSAVGDALRFGLDTEDSDVGRFGHGRGSSRGA